MRYKRTAAALLALVALFSTARIARADNAINVTPPDPTRGALVTVTGSGFNPGVLYIEWDSDTVGVQIAETQVGSDGSFSVICKVPETAAPGRHQVTAAGPGQASNPFTVTVVQARTTPSPKATPSPSATATATSSSASSGDSVQFGSTGSLISAIALIAISIGVLGYLAVRRR